MNRAAILIGVGASKFPGPLPSVAACLQAMKTWLLAQPGFESEENDRIRVFSDAEEPVTNYKVLEQVTKFVEQGTITQLIIYFVGHGMMRGQDEYWFCSDADKNPGGFIDVPNSRVNARYCGIPHVVFISDACRSFTNDTRFNATSGSGIFPYMNNALPKSGVDMFFGASIGEPTLEAKIDPATNTHESVYTAAVTAALRGNIADLNSLHVSKSGISAFGVCCQDLGEYLEKAIPRRLAELKIRNYRQRPDDELGSRHPAMISWLPEPVDAPAKGITPTTEVPSDTLDELLERFRLVSRPIDFDLGAVMETQPVSASSDTAEDDRHNGIRRYVEGFGQVTFSNGMLERVLDFLLRPHNRKWNPQRVNAFRNRTAYVVNDGVRGLWTNAPHVYRTGTGLRITRLNGWATALIEFEDGRGIAVPLVPGYRLSVSYDSESAERVDVRYGSYFPRIPERELLRKVLNLHAVGELPTIRDEGTLKRLVDYLLISGPFDPALACAAASVLVKTPLLDAVRRLNRRFAQWYGFHLFDLQALAHERRHSKWEEKGMNPLPLMSRVWNVMETAFDTRVEGLPAFELKRQHVVTAPSFWTVLEPDGVNVVRDFIEKRRIS